MDKKNDKYKKKYILKQIENKWGYFECDGTTIVVKNCILKDKYNRIYQLIFHGGEAIDGLYLINAFDINIYHDAEDSRSIEIINKKYDKIAGYDDFNIHSFENKEKFIKWLIKEGFVSEGELGLINSYSIQENEKVSMPKFILTS